MYNQTLDNSRSTDTTATKEFFANVYAYMFGALTITGVISYVASQSLSFLQIMFTERGLSPVGYLIVFSPLAIALIIQTAVNRLSMPFLLGLFMLYAVLLGLSLSPIFLIYTHSSIALTFFTTAGAFGAMAVLGYVTKIDLTKFGSLMYMLFIGMFIASLVNFFMQSEGMSYVISFIGLFVFTGLTAYQMQYLKNIANEPGFDNVTRNKLALIGGFQLYVLFINLFLSILRFMGNRE